MNILPSDEEYLNTHNYVYEMHDEINQTLLVIKNYSVSNLFECNKADILIQIPKGYPIALLDMFWVYPHLKLRNTGNYPPEADVLEEKLGLSWQRFSRHYEWKPTYTLITHLNVIKEVLVLGRS